MIYVICVRIIHQILKCVISQINGNHSSWRSTCYITNYSELDFVFSSEIAIQREISLLIPVADCVRNGGERWNTMRAQW